MQRFLRMLAVAALLLGIGALPAAAAPAPKTVSVNIACASSNTVTVGTYVAKDDNLTIVGDATCNNFVADGVNFSPPTDRTLDASNSYTVTLSSRKQASAVNDPLTTVTLGAITVTIQNGTASATTAFTANTPPNGTVSSSYTYTFAANGGPNFYEVTAGSLPPGLTLAGYTGILSGTPTTANAYTFTVSAYNLSTETTFAGTSRTVTINAAASSAPLAPQTPTASAGDGEVTVTVTGNAGGDPATSFTVTGNPSGSCSINAPTGTPPSGSCTINSLTNGTPYTFTATGTNSIGTGVASGASTGVTPMGVQTITYAQPADQQLATGSLAVNPTTNAGGNTVTLTSNTTGVCTVSGFTITFVAAGTCTTTASAAATATYNAASNVARSFTITSSGGGGSSSSSSASPSASTTTERKVTLCHRTSSRSNPYVQITVDQSSVLSEGHGSHTGPLFPEANWGDIIPPFDGYAGLNWPAGQAIYDSGCDGMKSGKVTLCHATASKTNPYVLITVDQNAVLKKGHGSHTGPLFPQAKWGDIIPPFPGYAGLNWPGGQTILDSGCDPNGTPATASSRTPEPQPSGLATPAPAPTSGPKDLKPKDVKFEPGPTPGEVKIVDKDGKPLTLLDATPTDGTEIEIVSKGADLNKPTVWEDLGYGELCWKLEPFNDQYLYTLPNPIQPPSTAGAGPWFYKNVIVKAGSVTSSDSTLQPNTVFSSPAPGDVVWADVNANGIFDPGGQGKDKAISHIIICASTKGTAPTSTPSGQSESPSPSSSPSSSEATSSPSPSSSGSTESPSGSSSSPTPSTSGSTSESSSPGPSSSSPSASSSSPSPSTSSTPSSSSSPTIAPPGKDKPPAPIIIRIKDPDPSESPSPSSSSSPSESGSTPSSSSSTSTPSTSTSTSSPSGSPSSSSPSGSSSTSSPSGSSSTSSPSGSSSSSPSGSATTDGSSSPSPSNSPTGSATSGGSSTPSPSGSTSSSSGGSTPVPTGGPSTSTDPSSTPEDTTPGDNAEDRAGNVKLTIAKGDSVITMEVPISRLTRAANKSGSDPAGSQTTASGSGLADTGSDVAPARAAIAALAVLALILVPTQVRRRRS